MRWGRLLFWAVASTLLGMAAPRSLSLWGCLPDFPAALAVLVALRSEPDRAPAQLWTIGLVQDVLSSVRPGLFSLSWLSIGLLVRWQRPGGFWRRPATGAALAALAALATNGVYFLATRLATQGAGAFSEGTTVLAIAALTGLVAWPAGFVLDALPASLQPGARGASRTGY